MGVFNEFHLSENKECKKCKKCKKEIKQVQNKSFECLMESFYIGDVVEEGYTGIVKEELFCFNCSNFGEDIYLGFKDGIYISSGDKEEEVKKDIEDFKKENLISLFYKKSKKLKKKEELIVNISSTLNQILNYNEKEIENNKIAEFLYRDVVGKSKNQVIKEMVEKIEKEGY